MAWSYRLNAADEVYANEPGPTVFDPNDAAVVGGGVKIAVLNNVTPLVVGQAYVDVTFDTQPDDQWLFVECQVVNTADANPLNLLIGLLTNKTDHGFRLYFNGLPDTVNYFLHWAINIPNVAADTYLLSGPTTGMIGLPTTPFTIALPPHTYIDSVLTVVPHDGGAGGTFAPTSMFLTTGSPMATFTYTPATVGSKTISTTNSSTLINPPTLGLLVSAPVYATTYTMTGPTSGRINVASTNFTVALPGGATVPTPVTVTPSDGGAGGTFTPATVTLSSSTPSATFTYTPSTYGARTISVTNSGGLTNPSVISYTSLASTYLFTGPSTGQIGGPSSNFHVTLPSGGVVVGTVTVTPNDSGGGGTFTPASVGLTFAAPDATFTYTPAALGAKTLGVSNNGGLTDPGALVYTVTPHAMSDGDPLNLWSDSSGNGNDATGSGSSRPIYKTNILNGKPVVRFTTTGASRLSLTVPISAVGEFRMLAVMKGASAGATIRSLLSNTATPAPYGVLSVGTGGDLVALNNTVEAGYFTPNPYIAGWHIYDAHITNSAAGFYIDGTSIATTPFASATTGTLDMIGGSATGSGSYSDGDLAEIVMLPLSWTDPQVANIVKGLGTKYGIATTGGTGGVLPDFYGNPLFWWKADSIV